MLLNILFAFVALAALAILFSRAPGSFSELQLLERKLFLVGTLVTSLAMIVPWGRWMSLPSPGGNLGFVSLPVAGLGRRERDAAGRRFQQRDRRPRVRVLADRRVRALEAASLGRVGVARRPSQPRCRHRDPGQPPLSPDDSAAAGLYHTWELRLAACLACSGADSGCAPPRDHDLAARPGSPSGVTSPPTAAS
jgi:hypothetical protein